VAQKHSRLNRRRVIIPYVIAGEGLRFKRTVEINLMIMKRWKEWIGFVVAKSRIFQCAA
jgi:hypothetical protein